MCQSGLLLDHFLVIIPKILCQPSRKRKIIKLFYLFGKPASSSCSAGRLLHYSLSLSQPQVCLLLLSNNTCCDLASAALLRTAPLTDIANLFAWTQTDRKIYFFFIAGCFSASSSPFLFNVFLQDTFHQIVLECDAVTSTLILLL